MSDGDRFVRCGQGHVHWGRFGAAGLLPFCDGHVLLQQRATITVGGGTWGVFGGARAREETAVEAALRETGEDLDAEPPEQHQPRGRAEQQPDEHAAAP